MNTLQNSYKIYNFTLTMPTDETLFPYFHQWSVTLQLSVGHSAHGLWVLLLGYSEFNVNDMPAVVIHPVLNVL